MNKLDLNTAFTVAKIFLAIKIIKKDDFLITVHYLMDGTFEKEFKMKKAKKPKKGGKKK